MANWDIMFHGMPFGRLYRHPKHSTTIDMFDNFPQLPYSTRCEITKVCWEQAKLIDITARITK